MSMEIKVPVLPESVQDATVATWHKKAGDAVNRDEPLVDLETDKIVLEVSAPESGVLTSILHEAGSVVKADVILGEIDTKAVAAKPDPVVDKAASVEKSSASQAATPSARRESGIHGVDLSQVKGSGRSQQITDVDVRQFASHPSSRAIGGMMRPQERVPMSRMRARIAERLLSAQHESAILTTFNEINLAALMDVRRRYKEIFEKKHGVKLGFMSFFTKAVIEALKRFPSVNASIDGTDVIYHGFFDIGIAVSTEKGLVVPIIRDADQCSIAELEQSIGELAQRARMGQLTMEELSGGTFTITNGGVFGSLMSTPIINPPQTGILGMHKIQERVVVENGQMVIRPMMYVALSYDHRLIDGRESVQFLVTVKDFLEDPTRLLLEV